MTQSKFAGVCFLRLLIAVCIASATLVLQAQTSPSATTPVEGSLLESLTGSSILNQKFDSRPATSATFANEPAVKTLSKPTMKLGLFTKLHLAMTDINDDDGIDTNDPDSDVALYPHMTRLWMAGALWNEDIAYKLSATYKSSKSSGTFLVDDMFINYKLSGSDAQLRVGQILIPFVREVNFSPMTNYFADYSLLVTKNGGLVGRDVGLMFHGVTDLGIDRYLSYAMTVMDGRGQNLSVRGEKGTYSAGPLAGISIKESDMLYSGRLAIYAGPSKNGSTSQEGCTSSNDPFELELGIGAIFVKGSDGDITNTRMPDDALTAGDGEDPEARGFGIDLAIQGIRGLAMNAEYIRKQTNLGISGADDVEAQGWRVEGSLFFNDTYGAIGVRYAYFDPNLDVDNNRLVQYGIGWNKYIDNQGHLHRICLDYSIQEENVSSTQTKTTSTILAGWQIQL